MPHSKDTTIIEEIGVFFEKSTGNAMQRVINVLNGIKMSDRALGLRTGCNARRNTSEKVTLLTLFPFFGVKNPNGYPSSSLAGIVSSGKDQLYRLLNADTVDWRKLNYKVFNALCRKIKGNGESEAPTCLIVDDTDLPKRGFHIESIGKVYSHVTHTFSLGFKMLALAFDDGKQLLNTDFSIHGEKGRNGNYGLTDRQLGNRKRVSHDLNGADTERVMEYGMSKIDVLIDMIRRFVRCGHKADYLLADSWFTCAEPVRFVHRLRCGMHYLGMAKIGNTKYGVNGKGVTAKQLLRHKYKRTRNRRLHCQHFLVSADFQGVPVRLFFCRKNDCKDWRVILTTDCGLNFEEAYRLYARRRDIEVFFKECKQNLNLGGCQSRRFNAQIAATTISMIQYNLLATAKRFDGYETSGELFRAAGVGVTEQTVTQRIWMAISTLIEEIAEFLNVDTDPLLEKYLFDNENFTKFINLKTFMWAG